MRAKKAVRWECSTGELLLEEPLDERFTKVTAEPSSDGLVLPSEIEENVQGYDCAECGEAHEGQPEKREGFVCGECDEFYDDREDAKECCK